MTDVVAARLVVEVGAKDTGLDAFLARVEARLRAADASGQKSGQGMGAGLSRGAQQGEAGFLRLQAAQARYEAQTGNTEGAIQRLRSALANVSTSTPQTIGLQTQL